MADQYDFGNLSPIEFEALVSDLLSSECGVRFETFSEGADEGIDARYSNAGDTFILQAKHYKNSSWSDLQTAAKTESPKIHKLNPTKYFFLTSQSLTPAKKDKLKQKLNHPSVTVSTIMGKAEINDLLRKHSDVEKRHIKLWLSSSAVLERLLTNDIAVYTEATKEGLERSFKVFVANPSLARAAEVLKKHHCLIVSGPPGVGKTTLAQILAAEYCEDNWGLLAISSIEEAYKSFQKEKKQVFIFDDFLGKIKLDTRSLAKDESKIAQFMQLVASRRDKRFILTTRKYILEKARTTSEAIDNNHTDLTEIELDLEVYTREIKARILYNHLYHSSLKENAIKALLEGGTIARIVDHPNYMPRIIDWMTDHVRFIDIAPEKYPQSFIQALAKPDKIWEKPFQEHISSEARILLYCMYFSRREGFFDRGINVEKLKDFCVRALTVFGIKNDWNGSKSRFENTLREVKSSFIVVQEGKVNFINPSVQDFLARKVRDIDIMVGLANSTTTFDIAEDIWKASSEYFEPKPAKVTKIANAILTQILSGEVEGLLSLEKLGPLLGDLLIASDKSDVADFLRAGGVASNYCIIEEELPHLLYELMVGKYVNLQYAKLCGRWLRLRLFKFLSQRDSVLPIDELGVLAENLSTYGETMCERFREHFIEAASECIDSLEVTEIDDGDRSEEVVNECLMHMERIDNYIGQHLNYSKRVELERHIDAIHQYNEYMEEMWHEEESLYRSSASSGNFNSQGLLSRLDAASVAFSNEDLSNMFSSLKK